MFRTIETEGIQYPDLASFNRRFALDCIGLGGFVRHAKFWKMAICSVMLTYIFIKSFDMGSVANPNSKYSTIYNTAFGMSLRAHIGWFTSVIAYPFM